MTTSGDPAGGWTFEPPTYPTAPLPVSCDLPCVGKVYSLRLPTDDYPPSLWVCSYERIERVKDEGMITGGWMLQTGYQQTREIVESELTLPLTLALPSDVPRNGSLFWHISSVRDIPLKAVNGTHVAAVLTLGNYYKDSLGTALTPCDAPPFVSWEQWDARWQAIYQVWQPHIGETAWLETTYFTWRFAPIGEIVPNTGNMIPLYAGALGLIGAALSGSQSGGGVMGAASMAFVLALLQAASSSSAAAGGRILKNGEREESFDLLL